MWRLAMAWESWGSGIMWVNSPGEEERMAEELGWEKRGYKWEKTWQENSG